MSMSYRCTIDYNNMDKGKNPILNCANERHKRRPSQFDRALHRFYHEPRHIFGHQLSDSIFNRFYWGIRAIQFRLFYRNEELDDEDLSDMKWEVGIHPPPLSELAASTGFDRKWIKYMYSKFKNECPTGRMREPEFKRVMASIIAPEKASDQYLSRLFRAFSSGGDSGAVTFKSLIECLSFVTPQTAEANADWTIRIITGRPELYFKFGDFLQFTQSIFALQEGKESANSRELENKETVRQRATTIFQELDQDKDGIVRKEDMTRFFKSFEKCDQEVPK